MPTAANQLEQYAEVMRQIYADAETTMLEKTRRRLERGIEEEGWAYKKLAETQELRREINAQLNKLGGSFKGLGKAVEEAYEAGSREAIKDLGKFQITNLNADLAKFDYLQIRTLVAKAVDRISSTHLRILRTVQDEYRNIIMLSSSQVATGTMSKWEAVQSGLNRFADRGITGFVDKAGRRWNLSSYAEMATRSATGQAAIQGHVNRLVANDRDLVIVSDHQEECPLCRPWERKILSISGNTPGYPTLQEAIGAGLFHPNCGHMITAYVEGLTIVGKPESNPKLYEQRKKQRCNERQIRKWKNRAAVAIDPAEQRKANAQIKAWQGKQRELIHDTGRRRQYDREKIRDNGDPGGTANKLNVLNPPPLKKIKAVPKPKIIDEKRAREHSAKLNQRSHDLYMQKGNTSHYSEMSEMLAARAGVSEEAALGFVEGWACTSGDSDVRAIARQLAVRDEFAQKAVLAHMQTNPKVFASAKRLYAETGSDLRKLVRAQYEITQEYLEAAGIDAVYAFRGCGIDLKTWESFKSAGAKANPAKRGKVSLQPASSFTTDRWVVLQFMSGSTEYGAKQGQVSVRLECAIPRERILSTSLRGIGCLDESEIVVLGSEPTEVVGYTSEKIPLLEE